MEITVEIIDRVYYNILEFCEINGLDADEYMSNAIMERYNLDKYGDLNEKIVSNEKVAETKCKTVRTKKIKEEKTDNEQNITPQVVEDKQTEPKEEEKRVPILDTTIAETNDKPTNKVKRTLKAK